MKIKMGILANVTSSIMITARLSYNASVRHYTSLLQVLYGQQEDKNLLYHKLAVRKFYEGDKTETTRKQFVRGTELEQNSFDSSIFPIALIDLNPFNIKSSKILLIPLNGHDADEHSIKNTIMSIFSKPKNLKQIEAFSQALKNVSTYQDSTAGDAKYWPKANKKDTHTKYVFDEGKRILKDSHIKNTSNHTPLEQKNLDVIPSMNYLGRLTSAMDKALQQCCLHSMQMWTNTNIPNKRTKNLIGYSLPLESHKANKTENTSFSSLTKIGESNVILEKIFWNRKIQFPEFKSSSLNNNTFPICFIKKSYSSKSRPLLQQNASTKKFKENQAIEIVMHNEVTSTIRLSAFSSSTSSKCIANYNFPFLTNLFDTNDILMSCDAYNKALVEAAKRRAALADCVKKIGKSENSIYKRPQVISINSCSDPKQNSQPSVKISDHYPPPMKSKSQTDSGCKKDDPCKPRGCPDPCKDEIEKLQILKDEEMKRKMKKTPSGCVSPKCKKDNSCTKHKKSPCKTASNEKIYSNIKLSSKNITPEKQMKDNCKKDDPCKLIECPDLCKDEIEKLKNLETGNIKSKSKNMSTGCTSPKCKKEDSCSKRKKSPCKKLHGSGQLQNSSNCAQNISDCKKGIRKKQKHPSTVEHKKCDKNTCKKDESYCGGPKELHKSNEYGKKEEFFKEKKNPCMKNKDCCKKKEDPFKKENPCTRQDNCGDKKNPCKKEEDLCRRKEDPRKKQEDPCKKEDSGDSKKENPCKQKQSNPCGSGKPTGPCKSKKDSKTVRETSSSSSNFYVKKSKSSCGKPKGQTNPNCRKSFSTLSLIESYNINTLMKRTYTSFITLSLLENNNLPNFDFMRCFSSKGGGKKDKISEDLGKTSQCNSTATIVPAKRKPAYNPHPKDGLRKCYPTYDMDCKKLCKDAYKTDCKKYAFLKETDNNKRNGKK